MDGVGSKTSEAAIRSLSESTVIGPPLTLDKIRTGFQFTREKLLEIPWAEIIADNMDPKDPAMPEYRSGEAAVPFQYLKNKFHTKFWDDVKFDLRCVSAAADKVFLPDQNFIIAVSDEVDKQIKAKKLPILVSGLTGRRVPRATATIPLNKSFGVQGNLWLLRVPTATLDRFFLPLKRGMGGSLEPFVDATDFDTEAHVGETWKQVDRVQQVFYADAKSRKLETAPEAGAKDGFSSVIEVDAAASHILREWNTYKAYAALSKARQDAADGLLEAAKKQNLSVAEWVDINERFLQLQLSPTITGMAEAIRDRAAALGYVLYTEDNPKVQYYNESGQPYTEPLKAGTLYRKYPKTEVWYTSHGRTYVALAPVPHIGRRRRRRRHEVTFTYYEEVKPDFDPWFEASAQYEIEGYEVHFARLAPDGYVTEGGEFVRDILQHCQDDEEYRRRCVIALPTFEQSITGQSIIRSYQFYFRPLPGLVPNEAPLVLLNEFLNYKFTWCGACLGELAATIPLSPGEQRSVTVSRSVVKENSRSMSSSSIVELNTVTRQDFESTFEREVTHEAEKTKTMSAEASGSYGGIVSGGASFSQTQRTRDVARTLNRAVQRSASEVSTKQRQEVTASTSSRVTETLSDSTSYKVENINTGTTLNLMIFRLSNQYQSELWLDDFECSVEAGPPLIEGTRIRERVVFRKHPRDLFAMARYLAEDHYGVEIMDKDEFVADITGAIVLAAKEDYDVPAESEQKAGAGGQKLKALLTFIPDSTVFEAGDKDRSFESYVKKRNTLAPQIRAANDMKMLALAELSDQAVLDKLEFAYDSGALYVECRLGENFGLEPYASQMREIEADTKRADLELTRAKAALLYAAAGTTGTQGSAGTKILGPMIARPGKGLLITFVLVGMKNTDAFQLYDKTSNKQVAAKKEVQEMTEDHIALAFSVQAPDLQALSVLNDAQIATRLEVRQA